MDIVLRFSCRHEYSMCRPDGGVTDVSRCICNSCQPYNAVLIFDKACFVCGQYDALSLSEHIDSIPESVEAASANPSFFRTSPPALRKVQTDSLSDAAKGSLRRLR
jgi:hypothetical protein